MTDQVPDFIDGDLNLSNRVKAAWLNDVNDAVYRANSGIAGATPNRTLLNKLSDIVSVKDFMTAAQIANYEAGTSTLDMAVPFQAAVTASPCVYFPPTAGCKCTVTITLQSSGKVYGAGIGQTRINFWGSDGFTAAAGSGSIVVSDMALYGYTAGGAVDAKTKNGVAFNGTTGSHVVNSAVSNLYLRGWANAVYFAYSWQCDITNILTAICTNGIQSFGQSVTVSVSGCALFVDGGGGNASILFTNDAGNKAEGWHISNCTLTSGAYGIYSDLGIGASLRVTNNTIDLITDTGLYLTNPTDSGIVNNWIYATNYGIKLNALGSPVNVGCKIIGNDITCTAANAKNVYVGDNTGGVTVTENTMIGTGVGGTEYLVYVADSTLGGVIVDNNDFTKASANTSGFFNAPKCYWGLNSGADTVVFNAARSSPITTQTGATYTVLHTDTDIIANRAGTVTLTLESAADMQGRKPLTVRTIQAQTVVSASANVVPLVGGAAGTAILAATAGKWAKLVSDGTNWQIMEGN